MRKISWFIFLLVFCAGIPAQAQEYSVRGRILDSRTEEALPMATVALLTTGDSAIVKGGITDENGNFRITTSAGRYILQVKYISYKSVYQSDIVLNRNNPEIDVGTIVLHPATENIEEVVVTGEMSTMTMEGGKKIFNVGTDLSTSGATAAEVLENIPSVTIDIEGNISLRGSAGVRILVNGKPSSMMGISGAEALRYYPANQIEKVEVITNPSAKYEAQGTAGIINIILKEEEERGLNGTFVVETGIPKDHGASLNMNYRKKWFNIFANYNINTDRYPGGGWREQTYNYPDTTYSLRSEIDRSRGGLNQSFRFGSDFYFSPNDVLKVSGVFSIEDEDNYTDITYLNYTGERIHADDLSERSMRHELEQEDENDYEINLNYEKTFGEDDHVLMADLQARRSIEIEDAELVETTGMPGEIADTSLFQNSMNDSKVRAYLAKLDYTVPFGEDGEFEAGFRGEYRDIRNLFYVEQRATEADPWNRLEDFSNTFFYEEMIAGVYSMIGNKIGKIGYQAGMRLEYTGIGTRLKTEAEQNKRDYLNLFPSASLSYDIDEQNSVQISYSRRLDRPSFRRLNPFNTFVDDRNYRTGNPGLDPEFTGAFDLGYIYNETEQSLYAGIFYRRTVNEMERVDTINDEGVTISTPVNLSSRENLGLEARYSREMNEWWDFSLSSFFYHQSTSGFMFGEDLNAAAFTMDLRGTVNVDVRDWFEFQVIGDYRAPEKEGQDIEEAMYEIDVGLRKKFLDNKANLAFSIRDILGSDEYRSRTEGSNFTSRRMFVWRRGPIFSLSFSYTLKDRDTQTEDSGNFIMGNGGANGD